MSWSFLFLDETVRAELNVLPADIRASFEHIIRLVQSIGLERVHEPFLKHLEGPLWEMRLRGRSGIARAICLTAGQQRVVILRVFMKKTQKTPRREIELARERAKDLPWRRN